MDSDDDTPTQPLILSTADLRAGDFEQPVRGLMKADVYDLSTSYRKAMTEVEETTPQHRAWALMHALTEIGLHPDDKGRLWVPAFTNGPRRTALPGDFIGSQSDALAELLAETVHPALRARLADIVWTNDRRKGDAARIAIDAYCECGEALLAGTMSSFVEDRGGVLFSAVDIVHRALQIAYASSKRGQMPARPKDLVAALVSAARSDLAYVAFTRAAEIGLHFEILDRAEAAKWAEELAGSAKIGEYAMAVHGTWTFAAGLYTAIDDKDGRQRALKGALTQTLAMRTQVGSAGAEAHWVMTALQELRHIEGMNELELELEVELRRLQKASLKELGSFKIEIDVKDDREAVERFFSDCTLSQGLREFALLDSSRDVDELRKEALGSLESAPLASMFSAVHLDDQGRTASMSGPGSTSDKPAETWFTHTIERSESLRRVHTVAGRLHPARMLLNARFSLEDRHFSALTHHSPFVPTSQAPIFSLGFARFFQGDFMSAAHLLIPQLEPSLRYLLAQHGHDPSKRRDDSTEEDLSLGGMFDRKRAELESILGRDLASEIDRLFNARPGPALRHEMAHGQLSAGACFSETVYYASWLLYRMAALPLAGVWDQAVTPSL